MIVCSSPGPFIGVPFDGALGLVGLGFGLGGQALGGYKPQIYRIVPEEGCNCGCKKKKEKKKKVSKCCCKCSCRTDEEDHSRLRYIPDAAMQLATMLPV